MVKSPLKPSEKGKCHTASVQVNIEEEIQLLEDAATNAVVEFETTIAERKKLINKQVLRRAAEETAPYKIQLVSLVSILYEMC